MLLIAGFVSIHELTSISNSVQNMLDDNYKSIEASRIMLEALEREDSGILLLLMGSWDEGRAILTESDKFFLQGFKIAKHNLTIADESSYVDQIQKDYLQFKTVWEKPIVGTDKEGNFTWYYNQSHQKFLDVKHAVKKLMKLNQETMYATSTELKNRSKRSVMPGIVSIIAAIVFTLLFNYYVHFYITRPIVKITKAVEDYSMCKKPFEVDIETNDEIGRLTNSIKALLQ